jgi:dethiobiotin synthetase
MSNIIFITGTDTGVGKTLLTALLLHHLRQRGVHALAMKPFCSGGLADVRLLQSLQPGELTDREMNPFYFKEPVAPLVAAEKHHRVIQLREVIESIRLVARRCDCLLVEGSGGLLVPLGADWTVADLIARLDCRVLVAARNRLGTINHTLLTVKMLETLGIGKRKLAVALMSGGRPDLSSRTNERVLARFLTPRLVVSIPFFGVNASKTTTIRKSSPKIRKKIAVLARFGGVN